MVYNVQKLLKPFDSLLGILSSNFLNHAKYFILTFLELKGHLAINQFKMIALLIFFWK